METIRGRDICDENLRIKTVVFSLSGSAGAEGIQDQLAEKVFSERVDDLGTLRVRLN